MKNTYKKSSLNNSISKILLLKDLIIKDIVIKITHLKNLTNTLFQKYTVNSYIKLALDNETYDYLVLNKTCKKSSNGFLPKLNNKRQAHRLTSYNNFTFNVMKTPMMKTYLVKNTPLIKLSCCGMTTLMHTSWDNISRTEKYIPLVRHHNLPMVKYRGELIPRWRTLDHKINIVKPIDIAPSHVKLQTSIISKKEQTLQLIKSPKGGLFKPLKTDHSNIYWDLEKQPFWENITFKGSPLINAENGILLCLGGTFLKLQNDMPIEELITLSLFKIGHLGHNINLLQNFSMNKRIYFPPSLNLETSVSPEILQHLDTRALSCLRSINPSKITNYIEILSIYCLNSNHPERKPLIYSQEPLVLGYNNTDNKHPDAYFLLQKPVTTINKYNVIEHYFDVKAKIESGRFFKLGKYDELRVVWENITLNCEKNQQALKLQIERKMTMMSVEDRTEATNFIISMNKYLNAFKSNHNAFQFLYKSNELFYNNQDLLLKYEIPMSLLVYFPKSAFVINPQNEKLFLETFLKIKNIPFPQYVTDLPMPIKNPYEHIKDFYDVICKLF